MRIEIFAAPFDPAAALARFAAAHEGAGALASFTGYCRREAGFDVVERLELEHYPGFTEAEIARLAGAVAERCALIDLLVIHRVGPINAGEAIVLVAAQSRHRAEAFAAVESLMDYLKTDAPIWKREITAQGARWIEPSAADRARRERHQ